MKPNQLERAKDSCATTDSRQPRAGFEPSVYASVMSALRRAKDPTARLVARLSLYTGARLGEVLDAKWADIDLQARTWRLRSAKDGRTRTVPLSASALRVLGALSRVPAEGGSISGGSAQRVAVLFGQLTQIAGGRGFHFHCLRAEAEKRMRARGVLSAAEIGDILGRPLLAGAQSPRGSLGHFIHLRQERARRRK